MAGALLEQPESLPQLLRVQLLIRHVEGLVDAVTEADDRGLAVKPYHLQYILHAVAVESGVVGKDKLVAFARRYLLHCKGMASRMWDGQELKESRLRQQNIGPRRNAEESLGSAVDKMVDGHSFRVSLHGPGVDGEISPADPQDVPDVWPDFEHHVLRIHIQLKGPQLRCALGIGGQPLAYLLPPVLRQGDAVVYSTPFHIPQQQIPVLANVVQSAHYPVEKHAVDGSDIPLRQGKADFDVGQILHLFREKHLLGHTVVGGIKGPITVQPLIQGCGAYAAHLPAGQRGPGKFPHLKDLAEEGLRRHLGVVLLHHAENPAVNVVIMDQHVRPGDRNVLGSAGAAGGDSKVYRLFLRQLTGAAGEQVFDIGLIVPMTGEWHPTLKFLCGSDLGKPIAHPIFC